MDTVLTRPDSLSIPLGGPGHVVGLQTLESCQNFGESINGGDAESI